MKNISSLNKTLKTFGIIVILVLLTGVAQAEDWPMFRHNSARTGATSDVLEPPLKLLWKFKVGTTCSQPIVSDGILYINTYGVDSGLYALDAKTGKQIWKFSYLSHDGRILSLSKSFLISHGIIYIPVEYKIAWIYEPCLYALNAKTGKIVWPYEFGANELIASDRVVFVGYHGGVYALDGKTGGLIWETKINKSSPDSLAFSAGIIYFGSMRGNDYLYALDAKAGKLMWKYEFNKGSNSFCSVMASEGIVYVSLDNDDYLYALDAKTGELKWKYKTGEIYPSPAISEGIVYVKTYDKNISALDANTGKLMWVFTANYVHSPTVSNGIIYIVCGYSSDTHFCALNANTGEQIWKSLNISVNGRYSLSSFVISDGIAYTTGDCFVHAFAPTSWEACASSYISYARNAIKESEKIGADTIHAKELLNKADNARIGSRYSEAANYAEQAKESAEEAYACSYIPYAQEAIEKAEKIGANVASAKTELGRAEGVLKWGYYLEAISSAKTAKLYAEESRKTKLIQYGIIVAVSLTLVSVSVAGIKIRKRRYEQKIDEYRAKIEQWKREGYDVSEFEEMLK